MNARRTIALVGDPVGASVSPAMHNAAFGAVGLPFEYVAIRIARGELRAALPDLRRRCAGLNLTTPHKEAVLPLLDAVTETATAAGSVNTVRFDDRGSLGDSTDGAGFLRALHQAVPGRKIGSAVVLGTGGAARAVAAALVGAGARVAVAGRRRAAADRIARDITGVRPLDPGDLVAAIAGADLLASAIPAIAWEGSDWPVGPDLLGPRSGPPLVVFDLVYRPRRTALLEQAAARGCVTIEGVEMLVEQGALSFTIWTGTVAPVDLMRDAAYAALDPAVAA